MLSLFRENEDICNEILSILEVLASSESDKWSYIDNLMDTKITKKRMIPGYMSNFIVH